ncbi:undecaprenyldiphospho-muramoylpentapeptide beta-N-acetylglucosaminyltransferase [Paenibacillus aquistagni]|uniref:UDP-N-acetylglucosamine--N-acetylmuramyl-(pentapeptide) pyrophosphoryl-undecaprenol N-acetylglucosamine transferase n=1 Tax=Paenibacillus aquistagni TaxID=1852522 RepID=A0A1X7IGD7_9BACL|nr:undecaprenyldiphospho-muramoylpentapeptide beta-N-acetylglucosaminyltransferase [Paenibacillus aquistagni]SMG13439.1 UDP-N-acetylglucosamine-N-acetylmuramylpentapeptide N-acetylglucosamine transferase [Paenibacillus aquistagni]
MRVVLSGGGTGGHIYPALAIARECKKSDPNSEFLYIGTEKGLESKLVRDEGLPFETIEITGFRRKLSFENVKTIMRFLRGVSRAKELLRTFKPDVVIGTGGYVCGPVVYAAAKLGIPTIIHEQNVIPGLTNKFLSRYASTVALSFEESKSYFDKAKHVLFTGNPRATAVVEANRERGFASLGLPQDSELVLVVGGSRGARVVNEAMIGMVPFLKKLPDVHFVYVTGQQYYEDTRKAVLQANSGLRNHLHVLPYVSNMPEVLAATTVAVSRAGASSLAELTALGIPSILIPSPNVTNNHQEANARSLEQAGAAVMLLESKLSAQQLFKEIEQLIVQRDKRKLMSDRAKAYGQPDSAARIVAEMKRLTGE